MTRRSVTTAVAAAAVAGTTLALLAQPAQASAPVAQHRAVTTKDARAVAIAAADQAVASGVDSLVKSSSESYRRTSVTPWVDDLFSVGYERTYHGLPVVGGDAVVLADGDGVVRATNSASSASVSVPTTATVSGAAAERTARARLAKVTTVDSRRLVVRMKDGAAHLAWETVLTGRTKKAAPSHLHVFVDARSGKVVDSYDDVRFGEGNSQWNGPNPNHIDTTQSGGTYQMKDPSRPGITCGDFDSHATFTSSNDVWGTGDETQRVTGCLDTMWATQHEWDMLKNWLGRNGLDGNGGGWPLYVGDPEENAYWDGSSINIGYNSRHQWIGSMDVVGHENGHGIDQHTPGGAGSEAGLGEGTGDIFGALTEAYTNEPSPYDVPDYSVGEAINLDGSGPIRYMYDPSKVGDPTCYSSSIPSTEVHAAAGPLDHWFYLMAEGNHPTDGQPTSPTCNGSNVTGMGIQNAGKVWYGAMLLKTSGFTYKKYRTATLTAAKNLDATCGLFNKTKAAWDAVSVPAQSADPTCSGTGGGSDFSMALSPSSGSVQAGGQTTATVTTATTSGSAGTVTLSASGAPSGVTVSFSPSSVTSGSSATMTVKASSTAASGTSTITVTGTEGSAVHTAQYSLTVGSTSPGCSGAEAVTNGGFESGSTGWTATSGVITTDTGEAAHAGTYKAWMDGYGQSHTDSVSQSVKVPSGCSKVTLSYYLHIDTDETTSSTAYDKLTVSVNGASKATYSNLNKASGYALKTIDLSSYAGQTVTLKWNGVEDTSLQTSFVVDDVSVKGS